MSDPRLDVKFIGRFHDAYLKYRHAQMHFAALVGLINSLLEQRWWLPEKVEGTKEGTVRIKILCHPTVEWSLVVGDWIHNLRSCLDYAICGMVEAADPAADLANIQFPFGRLGSPLNSDERKRLRGLAPEAVARIEAIRAEHGVDLNFVSLMSNQDKHRLLLPVTVRQVPMKLTIDEESNTASINDDIEGSAAVWTKEIKDGDEIVMPTMLKLGIGLLIEGEEMPFPLQDIERLNVAVWKTFMAICTTERSVLASALSGTPAIQTTGSYTAATSSRTSS
jgi:hypothetical protein